jgi:hypothetical protein
MKNLRGLGKGLLWTAVMASALPLGATAVLRSPVGTPGWEPVDAHLFSAAIGTPETGFAEFFNIVSSVLPPPNHVVDSSGVIRPGSPHPPPYDQEIGTSLKNLGLNDKAVFTPNEFSGGNGIFLAFMMVPAPGSVLGSSPDFSSGPVIPNGTFPIRLIASTYKGGVLFSTPSEFDTQPLDNFSGFSHTPDFYADSLVFASDPGAVAVGSYEYRVALTDSNGSGWNIIVPFEIAAPVPEPIARTLVGVGLATLFARRTARLIWPSKEGQGEASRLLS